MLPATNKQYVPMITSNTAIKNKLMADKGDSVVIAIKYPLDKEIKPMIVNHKRDLGSFSPVLLPKTSSMGFER